MRKSKHDDPLVPPSWTALSLLLRKRLDAKEALRRYLSNPETDSEEECTALCNAHNDTVLAIISHKPGNEIYELVEKLRLYFRLADAAENMSRPQTHRDWEPEPHDRTMTLFRKTIAREWERAWGPCLAIPPSADTATTKQAA